MFTVEQVEMEQKSLRGNWTSHSLKKIIIIFWHEHIVTVLSLYPLSTDSDLSGG